ncbi:Csu type fimbrial protein [Variovorax paradoxus]|uniref:Csu type fimbrial protein n=1 Tax=Variovorax paradoxus TaxID=34073 RepID=UPI00278562B1|nr:spore coat U domain-containing protein [Variovorax paradoxus]MDQ0586628.1 spore coat protein U-like protein [Variovorax paradoxus]
MKKSVRVRATRYCIALTMGVGLSAVASSALAGSCSVSSSGLMFGAYEPITFAGKLTSIDRTSTATVSVVCTNIAAGGGYTIGLGASNYGSGDRLSIRYLNNTPNGGDLMAFNVFTNASYTTVWGNGFTGAVLNGTIATGDSNQSHTVYGQIPAGQSTLKAGSFSDSLTVTLTYNP